MSDETKSIVISTTFRDFVGNKNDQMQIMFLNSLKRQKYQRFILVVSIFGEKNVEKIVKEKMGAKCIFIKENPTDYQFSISDTIKNGIIFGLENSYDIFLDCSSDIYLEKNMLQTIVQYYQEGYAGISHPNIVLEQKKNCFVKNLGHLDRGIDIRFFDINLFRDKEIYDLLMQYPIHDYGAGIEHITSALAIRFAICKINIFMESKVYKIDNERNNNLEMSDFMKQSIKKNHFILKKFILKEHFNVRIMDLLYIHRKFQIVGRKDKYIRIFATIYLKIYYQRGKYFIKKILKCD